jgi:hypothetical protein
LKDWLIPTQIFVRGFEKVSFLLMCGVLCLAAIKALQYFHPKLQTVWPVIEKLMINIGVVRFFTSPKGLLSTKS